MENNYFTGCFVRPMCSWKIIVPVRWKNSGLAGTIFIPFIRSSCGYRFQVMGGAGLAPAHPRTILMIQAYTGIMGITGEHDGAPVRCGGSPIDIATAYLAWGSILAGIHSASKTGEGVLLEVSLMELALGFMHAYLQAGLVGLPLAVRMGSETMGMYPMGAFQTQNGEYCLVQVSNDHQWRRFAMCSVLRTWRPTLPSRPIRCVSRTATRYGPGFNIT